jgi:tetratricopeptide (TPR) repeat protein
MGDQSGLAWGYYDTAWILHWKGNLAAAVDTARAALTHAQQAGERRVDVFIRCCLCAVHAALGDDNAAGDQGRAAIVLADGLGDPVARAGAGHALAYLHIQREEWQRASELFEEVDARLVDSDNKFTRLFCGAHAAETLWGLRQFESAMRGGDAALALARTAGSTPYEGLAQRVRGQVLTSLERWDEAGTALDAAAAILKPLGARMELGRVFYHRAVLHWLKGNAQAVREDAQRAIAAFADTGAPRDRSRAERLLDKPPH